MKKTKNLFSVIILILFILNNLMPNIIYAADNTSTENGGQKEVGREYELKEKETWDISKNGDESVIAKWTLEDRTLTISGIGKMKDWKEIRERNWDKYAYVIKKVVIERGVINIGDNAFNNCKSLIDVSIPNSVVIIGECVFSDCSSLTNIEIPNSVLSISSNAFNNCNSLKELKVDSENKNYVSIDGTMYDKNKTKIIKVINPKETTSYNILNSVTSIGEYAFSNCSNLTNIKMPDNVTSIGEYAFSNCSKLTNIEMSNNVTNIGEYAFLNCSSLTSIEIPDSVTSIEERAFYNCSSLTNIEMPNNVTSIGERAFSYCSSLTSIEIPNSVTSIGNDVFSNCSSLTNIEIPNSVTSIGEYAFLNCSKLTNIEMSNNVTSIGEHAFSNCSSLTSIEIPDSVTSIGYRAFAYCSSLTNIEIPNSVTSIGDEVFYYCRGPVICKTNSEAHQYAENDKIGYILLDNEESNYGLNYQIKENEIWDISKIGDDSIIAKWSFEDRTLTISGSGDMKDWENTTTEDWRGTKYKKVIEKVIIENGITSIGRYAFSGCSSLISIEIPNSVTNIGRSAFSGCSSLTSIKMPNGVTSIGDFEFYSCESLTNIEIPSSVKSIGERAFSDCSSLTNIEIPNNVTSIGDSAFSGCSSLTNIEIANSVKSIGRYAFWYCSSLTKIEIPCSVTSISEDTFYKCRRLKEIKVDGENQEYTSIDGVLFNKDKTELITFPCDKEVTKYIVPNSVIRIVWRAFLGCNSLTSIEIPSSVKSIGVDVFEGCSSLTNIEIPNSVTSIGDSAFSGCSSLTNIEIPNSVTSIEDYTFIGCSSLTNIEIPNSVTSIGYRAFENCSSLTNIEIPNSVTSIGRSAFEKCSSLKNIKILSNVKSIGYSAFSDCKGPIICKTNSEAHRYAEEEKVGYLLDEEPPEIVFTPKEYNKSQKQVSIKVDVTDLKVGVDESSLKYIWSKKEEVSKEEVKTSFTNASQIASPEKVTGTYYLHIYASDIFGNETIVKSNAIRLDNTPPVITGVSNKKIHFGKTKPIITDDNPIEVELTKDGTKVTTYTNGAEITGVGKYKITATDEVGNTAETEFEIEKIPDGKDGINYEMNPSELTNQDVKLTLSKKDETRYEDLKIQVSTDGENYEEASEKTVEQNGKIYARYAIDELVGVPLEIEIKNIDKTAAETEVTYSKTELTKENVQVTITANEKVQAINGWTLSSDGLKLTKEYEQNTEIDGEKVIVKDLAGNEKETIIKITNIDKEAPKVTGVQNGKSYSKKATPIVEDENLDTVKLIKKEKKTESSGSDENTQTSTGENTETNPIGTSEEIIETEVEGYKNGDTITELGDYKIIATDKVENTTIVEFSIKEIPDTKDVVNITKTPEGLTNQDVIVTISKKEDEEYKDLKIETSIDNKNYEEVETATKTITITLTENGTIYVRAVKGEIIGETLEVKVDNIDKIEPTANITYSITELTTQNVDVTISTNEKVQGVSGWTLSNDGLKLTKTYTANTKENGEEIVIKDLVGNETKKIIKVTNIDKTAPTITGVTNNQKYFRKATPKITDENINTIELTKDGEKVTNYTNGQEITGAGDYKLTATDKVGNSTIVNFSIYDIQTESYKEKIAENASFLGKINVGEKTSKIETLLKNVSSYKITRNGTEIYSSTNQNNDQDLYTGDKIEFESQVYTLIVTGDINKDGKANIIDLAKCMKVVLGKKTLDTIEGLAADTNFDGKVNIVDLAKIRKLSLDN